MQYIVDIYYNIWYSLSKYEHVAGGERLRQVPRRALRQAADGRREHAGAELYDVIWYDIIYFSIMFYSVILYDVVYSDYLVY